MSIKKILTYLFVIFLTITSNSQTTFNYDFNKRTDFFVTGYDGGYQSILFGDKIFANGAVTDSASGRLLTSTCTHDTLGNLLTKKTYGYPNYDKYIIQKTIKFNNCVYGIGQAFNYNDTVNDLDLLFIKFDNNGDTVFTKILHDTGSVIAVDIIRYSNKELLIAGNYARDYTHAMYTKTSFLRIDTLGNILQTKYTDSSLYQPSIFVHNPILKEYYVLGIYPSNTTSNFVYYSYLHCFDSLLQSKFIKNHLFSATNDVVLSATVSNNIIFLTSNASVTAPPPAGGVGSQLRFSKLRRIGNTVTTGSYIIGPIDGYFLDIGSGNIVVNYDNNVAFFPVFSNTGCHIYFCDTSLNLTCYARTWIADSAYYYATSIGLTPSNKIYGTGVYSPHYIGTSMSSWDFMTNEYKEFLNNGCGYVNIKEEKVLQNNFKLYPNPTANIVFLENYNLIDEELKIEFVNVIGQVIKTEQSMFNYKNSFIISDLSVGLYICKISSKTTQLAAIKFFKE